MSFKRYTPCDEYNYCPYMDSSGYVNCEYWCSADEPDPDPDLEPWEVEYEYIND